MFPNVRKPMPYTSVKLKCWRGSTTHFWWNWGCIVDARLLSLAQGEAPQLLPLVHVHPFEPFSSMYLHYNKAWLVVWNMFFPYILEIIIPTDFHMFQRDRYTTNQKHNPGMQRHLPGEALKFYCDERLHGRVLHPSQGQDVRLGWGKVPRGKWSSFMCCLCKVYVEDV